MDYYLTQDYAERATGVRKVELGRRYLSRIVGYKGPTISRNEHLGGLSDADDAPKHETMEQFLHTSVLFTKNRIASAYISTAYWPDDIYSTVRRSQENVRDATLRFTNKYGKQEEHLEREVYAKLRRHWEPDVQLRMETKRTNSEYGRSGTEEAAQRTSPSCT